MPVNSVRDDPHNAQGAIPFSGDQPPTKGPTNKHTSFNPSIPDGYDVDPDFGENVFPRESGSDSYTGIPGDGIVPG